MQNVMDFVFKLGWSLIRLKLRKADKVHSPVLYRINVVLRVLGVIVILIFAGSFLFFYIAYSGQGHHIG